MRTKGFADRVRFSWSQNIALEELVRYALRYRRAMYLAGRSKLTKKAIRRVERELAQLSELTFSLPPGLLAKVKRWRVDQ